MWIPGTWNLACYQACISFFFFLMQSRVLSIKLDIRILTVNMECYSFHQVQRESVLFFCDLIGIVLYCRGGWQEAAQTIKPQQKRPRKVDKQHSLAHTIFGIFVNACYIIPQCWVSTSLIKSLGKEGHHVDCPLLSMQLPTAHPFIDSLSSIHSLIPFVYLFISSFPIPIDCYPLLIHSLIPLVLAHSKISEMYPNFGIFSQRLACWGTGKEVQGRRRGWGRECGGKEEGEREGQALDPHFQRLFSPMYFYSQKLKNNKTNKIVCLGFQLPPLLACGHTKQILIRDFEIYQVHAILGSIDQCPNEFRTSSVIFWTSFLGNLSDTGCLDSAQGKPAEAGLMLGVCSLRGWPFHRSICALRLQTFTTPCHLFFCLLLLSKFPV